MGFEKLIDMAYTSRLESFINEARYNELLL